MRAGVREQGGAGMSRCTGGHFGSVALAPSVYGFQRLMTTVMFSIVI